MKHNFWKKIENSDHSVIDEIQSGDTLGDNPHNGFKSFVSLTKNEKPIPKFHEFFNQSKITNK